MRYGVRVHLRSQESAMRDAVRLRALRLVILTALLSPLPRLSAQLVDAHLRATDALTPRGEAAPLPAANVSVERGIGILADDGNSYWPGYPSDLHAPATFRIIPAANNTFVVRRVAYQFDDPSTGVVLFDGTKRPIVGFLDANYIPPAYTLATPITFAG